MKTISYALVDTLEVFGPGLTIARKPERSHAAVTDSAIHYDAVGLYKLALNGRYFLRVVFPSNVHDTKPSSVAYPGAPLRYVRITPEVLTGIVHDADARALVLENLESWPDNDPPHGGLVGVNLSNFGEVFSESTN